MNYKLSPSELTYLYNGCKFCFWLKVKHGIPQPSMPMPGIFSAIAIVMIRHLTKTVSTLQILFYYFLINTVMTALILPFQWQSLPSDILLLLLGVGIFGALYQLFSTLCFAKAPVRLISPIMSICMVTGGLVADFFIWNQLPNFLSFIGIVCVMLGGTLSIYFGQKELAQR